MAPKGKVLVILDYSQIELRILAHIADIPALQQAFRDGIDIHAMTASEMFNVPLDQMTSDIRRRPRRSTSASSTASRALALPATCASRGPRRRASSTAISNASPASRNTCPPPSHFAQENGYVQTLFGRKIHTPEINAKGPGAGFAKRAAINAPIQGTAADVIRRAMIRMPAAIAGIPAKMLLQVHDELLFEVEEDAAPALIAAAKAHDGRRRPPRRPPESAADRRGRAGAELGRGALIR